MKIILASASERRHMLLKSLGLSFEIAESGFDESEIMKKGFLPGETVETISRGKLFNIEANYNDALIITADTIVYFGGKVLGKPKDAEEAHEMLQMLSGKAHEVYTGVSFALKKAGAAEYRTFSDFARVTMRNLREDEISSYIDSGEPLGKAGAYNAGEKGGSFIERIEGDYNTVLGLPSGMLVRELEKLGISTI